MADSISDLLEMGSQAFRRGDFHRAAGYYQQAAGLAHQEGNVDAELHGWDMAARSWAGAGEILESFKVATCLLVRAREARNLYFQVDAFRLLLTVLALSNMRDRWEEVRPFLMENLEKAKQLGNPIVLCEYFLLLGFCSLVLGNLEDGLDWLQRAQGEIWKVSDEEMAKPYHIALYEGLSVYMALMDRSDEAFRYAEMATGIAEQAGIPALVANAKLIEAYLQAAFGKTEESLQMIEEVLDLNSQGEWKLIELGAQYLYSVLLQTVNILELAEGAARRALELAQETGLKEAEAQCLINLGEVLLLQDRGVEAREVLQKARRLSQERNYEDHFREAEELLSGL